MVDGESHRAREPRSTGRITGRAGDRVQRGDGGVVGWRRYLHQRQRGLSGYGAAHYDAILLDVPADIDGAHIQKIEAIAQIRRQREHHACGRRPVVAGNGGCQLGAGRGCIRHPRRAIPIAVWGAAGVVFHDSEGDRARFIHGAAHGLGTGAGELEDGLLVYERAKGHNGRGGVNGCWHREVLHHSYR